MPEISTKSTPANWHADFLARIKPAVERHAKVAFHKVPAEERQEMTQAATCLALSAYLDLIRKGKRHRISPTALARFSCLQTKAGRDIGRPMNSSDALSPWAREKRGYSAVRFGGPEDLPVELHEALSDDRRSPIPDLVAFRVDFGVWLSTLNCRLHRIAVRLAEGHRTMDVADKFGLTPGRISQLRREMEESWFRFQGELPAAA